jgi:hypothetical protein
VANVWVAERRKTAGHLYIWNGTALEPIKVEIFDAVDRGAQAS